MKQNLLGTALLAAAYFPAGCLRESYEPRYAWQQAAGPDTLIMESRLWVAAGEKEGEREFGRTYALFTVKFSLDSAGPGGIWRLEADSVEFHSVDRGQAENAFMSEKLEGYALDLALAATGQALRLEEEMSLPFLPYSGFDFARQLLLALPVFPSGAVKKGQHWESRQNLLETMEPKAEVVKRQRLLSAVSESGELLLEVEMELEVQGGMGEEKSVDPDRGRGRVVFNASRGRPERAHMEISRHVALDDAPGSLRLRREWELRRP